MKKAFYFLLITLIAIPAFTQEQTLFSGKIVHGGYGGPVVKFTTINDNFGSLVGGHGGWIINHALVIGGGGYGLVNDVEAYRPGPLGEKYIDFGYGGFEAEWVINSDKLVHFSIHSLIGGGAISRKHQNHDITYHNQESEGFFVLEPGATLDLNVTPWFRFSVGASFRYVNGVDSNSALTSDKDLTGPSAMLMLRFGKF